MRGQREDYDEWAAQAHDDTWRWDAVLPLFKRSEDHYLGATAFHGAGGEWRVEPQRLRWDILEAFARAAEEAGIPRTTDFNGGDNFGVGYFEVNQKKRHPLERVEGIPAARRGSRQPVDRDRRARAASDARRWRSAPASPIASATRDVTVSAREEVILAAGADQFAAAARALRHRRARRAARLRHCRSCTRCPASARTCRITCSCAASTRCATRAR